MAYHMKLTDLLRISVTNNLINHKDIDEFNKKILLNILFKDGTTEQVEATIHDSNLTEMHPPKNASKELKTLLENTVLAKYICIIGENIYNMFTQKEEWYRFFSFDVYLRDIEESKDVSSRIHEAMMSIVKANYLVTFSASSPINSDAKKVKYLISSNFALDAELPHVHPLLQVFKKLNPQLDLVVDSINNTFLGEDSLYNETVLVNKALGFVVRVHDVIKHYTPKCNEIDYIPASYFHNLFNPIISQTTSVIAEKCKI